jgi:hypothetical protein
MKNENKLEEKDESPALAVGALLAVWPEDRRKELIDLRDMLHELRSLNNGSNFLGKVERAIEVADRLTRSDLAARRNSFYSFLENQAVTRHPTNTKVTQMHSEDSASNPPSA